MLVTFLITVFLAISNPQAADQNNSIPALVIEADIVDCKNTPPIIKKDEVLLSVDIVKKYFDPNLFWDEKMYRVVTTGKYKAAKMKLNSNMVSVNNKLLKCGTPAKLIKGKKYLPINFLKNVYDINVKVNSNYNTVMIDYNHSPCRKGIVAQLVSPIRKDNFVSGDIVKMSKAGDEVEIFNIYKGWYKVRTKEGIVGFIEAQSVRLIPAVSSISQHESSILKAVKAPKISLAWDQMLNIDGINKIEGLHILSPFWFYVSDKDGTVKSKVSEESMKNYVKKAHQEGYKVWALFSNSFSPVISSSILNDGNLRDKVINQIVAYADTYDLDGINIDFENMSLKDRDMFTQFVRELAPILREQGMIVSVDVGAPSGNENVWGCCDAGALSQAADYIALMTYDQHWSNCPYSGSVAQYSWVENKLQAALEVVPPEKLLLGLPFYTRGWREDLDKNGSTKVTQYGVFSMNGAKDEVKNNKANVRWDSESGQLYAQYVKDNAIYKIWMENEDSINLKSSLVQKYNLAGVAIWEKSYAKPEVWRVLKQNLHRSKNYAEWIKYNKVLYGRIKNFKLCKR